MEDGRYRDHEQVFLVAYLGNVDPCVRCVDLGRLLAFTHLVESAYADR